MAWISFVIVALGFMFGLEQYIPHESFGFTLPFLMIPLNIPYSGYLRMFFYTLAIWAVLWLILNFIERVVGSKFYARAGLRNGFVFATRPWPINYLAVIVASVVLGITAIQFTLDLIQQILRGRLLGFLVDLITRNPTSAGYVFNPTTGIFQKGDLKLLPFIPNVPVIPIVPFFTGSSQPAFPIPAFPCNVLVLCFLTLIAAYFFRREQRSRYEAELRRNQIRRKQLQEEIKIPPSSQA